jgi:hypothetical protein
VDFELSHARDILERTPATLRVMLSGLDEQWLVNNEGPGTWSPVDVVKHLIHGEETDWIPRAQIILQHGESFTFEPFDPLAFEGRESSSGKALPELLDTFEALRSRNLAVLDAMEFNDSQLELRGTHPEFGTVTLGQLIATWATHDLSHIAQISRTMVKQYEAAVGPWRKYLSILK